jgi:hypothetical protein
MVDFVMSLFMGLYQILHAIPFVGPALKAVSDWFLSFPNIITWMVAGLVQMFNGLLAMIEDLASKVKLDLNLRRLSMDDYLPKVEEDPSDKGLQDGLRDNGEATIENTRAVRELSRELKNLPGGYKVQAADYYAQSPSARPGAPAGNQSRTRDTRRTGGDQNRPDFQWRP